MFGSTLAELMLRYNVCEVELEPTLAVCFLPTGGIVGPGNTSLIRGDLQWATVTHAVVHDAFGYLGHCHNVGPGYVICKLRLAADSNGCIHIVPRHQWSDGAPFQVQLLEDTFYISTNDISLIVPGRGNY